MPAPRRPLQELSVYPLRPCNAVGSQTRRLRSQLQPGAGDGNRTRMASLEGWSSTIELHPHRNITMHRREGGI